MAIGPILLAAGVVKQKICFISGSLLTSLRLVCFICSTLSSSLGAFTTKSCKNVPYSFAIPVFWSPCNKLRSAEWIFTKFDIGEFY